MIKVYNARDVLEAPEVVNLLKENEIPAYCQEGSGGVAAHDVSGFGLFGVDVYVDDGDEDKASQIIKSVMEEGNRVYLMNSTMVALREAQTEFQDVAEEAGLYGEADVVDMMKDFRKKRAKKK